MTKKEKKSKIKKTKEDRIKNKVSAKDRISKKTKLRKEKTKKPKVGFLKRVSNFFKEIKSELKKIVWPSKKELLNSTLTVMFVIVIMTLFVVLADKLFHSLLKLLIKKL